MIEIPKDPSLKDLQLVWESQFWYKSRRTWEFMARSYEMWKKAFGEDRKPRDIFRADVREFRDFLKKRGAKDSYIDAEMERGRRFFRYLDERELVEKDFNPFQF